MSFRITLQRNNSPSNKVDKQIIDVAYADGTLKESTSIIDPVIIISTNLSSNMIADINYIYCEEFHRYYYVTNIISIANDLWELHCHVDVLMTYKDEIRDQTAIVARQENKYNMYLDDGWFMSYQDPIIQTKYLSVDDPFENQEFVLVVAGS